MTTRAQLAFFSQTELPDLSAPTAAAVMEVFVLSDPLIAYAAIPSEATLTNEANPAAENSSDRVDHLRE
jgi:hypothetical protein